MADTNFRILLVEDEASLSSTLQSELASAGFEVETAQNGRVALEKLNQEEYSLLLLDLIMPEVDGQSVLNALDGIPKAKGMPVIVLTNLSSGEKVREIQKYQLSDFMVKSEHSIEEIIEKVKSVLNTPQPTMEKPATTTEA